MTAYITATGAFLPGYPVPNDEIEDYSAAIEVSGLLRSAGARSVEAVAATDTRPQWATFVTTLRWLLTGRRESFLWFERAGVGPAELDRVADVGRRIAEAGQCSQGAAPIVPTLAAADLLAGKVFRRWGATVRSARRFGALAQAASLATFVLGLATGMRGPRRRRAVQRAGGWFRASADLIRRGSRRRDGDRVTASPMSQSGDLDDR